MGGCTQYILISFAEVHEQKSYILDVPHIHHVHPVEDGSRLENLRYDIYDPNFFFKASTSSLRDSHELFSTLRV